MAPTISWTSLWQTLQRKFLCSHPSTSSRKTKKPMEEYQDEERSLSSYGADDSTLDASQMTYSTLYNNTSATTAFDEETTTTFTRRSNDDDDENTTLFTADVLDHYRHDNDQDTATLVPPSQPIPIQEQRQQQLRVPSLCFSPTAKTSNQTPKPTWSEQKHQLHQRQQQDSNRQKRSFSFFFHDDDVDTNQEEEDCSKSLGSLDSSRSSRSSVGSSATTCKDDDDDDDDDAQTFAPSLVLQVPYHFQRTTPRAVQARQQSMAIATSPAKRWKRSGGGGK